jgi:hypothetical protein
MYMKANIKHTTRATIVYEHTALKLLIYSRRHAKIVIILNVIVKGLILVA